MYAINALFAIVSVLYTLGDKKSSMLLYAVLLLLFIILVLKTDILYEKEEVLDNSKTSKNKGKKK